MSTTEADYIIIGGGLTGCTTAARLHQSNPFLKILIIEAGPDASSNPNIATPMGSFALTGSELDWQYPSLPDASTNNRVHMNNAGKALGGGTTINYGQWFRGDRADYDEVSKRPNSTFFPLGHPSFFLLFTTTILKSAITYPDNTQWAAQTNDPRWSYPSLLPSFKKSKSSHLSKTASSSHGLSGPIHITSVSETDPNRLYGLLKPLLDAWTEVGVQFNDSPTGSTRGTAEYTENWRDGKRQLAY